MCDRSSALTVAGPCWIYTSFPNYTGNLLNEIRITCGAHALGELLLGGPVRF